MYFGFRESDGETQNAAPAVLTDADGRENGDVADDAIDPCLLVSGVEEEIGEGTDGTGAPCLQFLIHERSSPADLRRGEAFHSELCHDPGLRRGRLFSTSRVETPWMYICAMASITARVERRPRSRDCG